MKQRTADYSDGGEAYGAQMLQRNTGYPVFSEPEFFPPAGIGGARTNAHDGGSEQSGGVRPGTRGRVMEIAVDRPLRTGSRRNQLEDRRRSTSHDVAVAEPESFRWMRAVACRIHRIQTPRSFNALLLLSAPLIGLLTALLYLFSGSVQDQVAAAGSALSSGDGAQIRDYLRSLGIWGPVVSLALMLAQAVIAPIPGVLIVMGNGLAYGAFWGGVLTLAGQTLAAAACFVIARRFGRSLVERIAGDINTGKTGQLMAKWGAAGIVATRLIPGFSFDLISYGAGLTAMPFRRFIIATVIGSAPQAFLYSYLMQESPMLAWGMVGFSLVVIAAIAAWSLLQRRNAAPAA